MEHANSIAEIKEIKALISEGNRLKRLPESSKVFETSNELYPVDYINSKVPLTDKWLRVQLDRLTEMGFLEVDGIKDDKQNRVVRHYKKLETMQKIYLLQFEDLLKNVGKTSKKEEM